MRYIKLFNENYGFEDYPGGEIMDRLSDCLQEVFDHFMIPMTQSGNFENGNRDFSWWNDCRDITIGNIPYFDSNILLYNIVSYIRSKRDMISNRLGYDISVGYYKDWISIRPLVPKVRRLLEW